jgi:membrane protein DedA with SNARE-associated domain
MDITSILTGSVAHNLHFISFGLLLLAGFNVPVSEDLVFIVSASIAAAVYPENAYIIFAGCFLGAYLSDLIAYSIGRHGLPFIQKFGFLKSDKMKERIVSLHIYFKKYGGKTLFFGRFIPFGVRNIMFITAGLVRVNIFKFMIIDFLALSVTSTILFAVGYKFGENIDLIMIYLSKYKITIFFIFLTVILIFILKHFLKRKS